MYDRTMCSLAFESFTECVIYVDELVHLELNLTKEK